MTNPNDYIRKGVSNPGYFGSQEYAGKKQVRFELIHTWYRIWVDEDGMFHRIDGPAAEGEDGSKVWFWHGVSMSILKDGPWWERWGLGNEKTH